MKKCFINACFKVEKYLHVLANVENERTTITRSHSAPASRDDEAQEPLLPQQLQLQPQDASNEGVSSVDNARVTNASPRQRCGLWILVVVVVLLDCTYYFMPLVFFGKDALKPSDIVVWMGWELFGLAVGFRSMFFCPMHIMLRGRPCSAPRIDQPDMNSPIGTLYKDGGALLVVVVFVSLCVVMMLSDNLLHIGFGLDPNVPVWVFVAYQLILLVVTICDLMPYVLANLALRLLVVQLRSLDSEVEARLYDTDNQFVHGEDASQANTPTSSYDPMVRSWLIYYESLRRAVNQFSTTCAPWFCGFMLFTFIELTTFYSQMIQGYENTSKYPFIMSIAVSGYYISSTVLLGLSITQMSQSVFVCEHEIGPKLATLSTRFPQHREFALFSHTVSQYPIHIHVGTLSILPEHATTAVAGLVAAFLVIVGLSSSGGR